MACNKQDNLKKLTEKILDSLIIKIFQILKMGLADWDIDDKLRLALQEPSNLQKIAGLTKNYDHTFNTAKSSNVDLNNKYSIVYNLNNKNDN